MAAKAEKKGGVGEFIKTVVYALLLAGLIRTLLFQPFWIPTGSMKPTLLIGDFLFVNKFAYGYSYNSCPSFRDYNLCFFLKDSDGRLLAGTPERGDVVVFRHPTAGLDYIKRLIGLPGDRIQMQNGQVFINGTAVAKAPDGTYSEIFEPQGSQSSRPRCINTAGLGAECLKEQFVETLPNGVSHATLNFTTSAKDTTGEYKVPEGHYFMMGDNRDNSIDSRWPQLAQGGVGFVPEENLIGRADRIIFSSAGKSLFFFWTWRGDRFFKAVN